MTYALDPMPAAISASLLSRLGAFETVLFGHFLDRGVLDPSVAPVFPVGTVVGTAVTLSLPALDSTLLHHAAGLLRPRDVLMIDRRGDRTAACLGGGVARALLNAGAAAVVIDGRHTDTGELSAIGLPVFSRGPSILTTRLQGQGGALNRPVSVGGVPILAGDAILADALGVVAIHAAELESTLTRADALLALTERTIVGVEAGQRIGDLSGASAIVASNMSAEG
ncbi:Regulator of RNase E activity RraA [Monaibacterium marinum]|uniref:Putative 4-hydroxy-4-methyl-2-oxoglutarate aldolase n=1 Tax=Pontivivens marinum TaxID=1690039 RepID=A0A2C9CWA2_9RHOB|nr:RraA family protein [Monaibacterium marinum]SOH95626.1 Regulator of RNase E activity RraA [Monaibacterium marinum]